MDREAGFAPGGVRRRKETTVGALCVAYRPVDDLLVDTIPIQLLSFTLRPRGHDHRDRVRKTVFDGGVGLVAAAQVDPPAVAVNDASDRCEADARASELVLAVQALEWTVPVVANSALMFGYAQREWRDAWNGWVYVDTVADDNAMRLQLQEVDRATAAGPVGVAGYDIGRLLGEAIARGDHLTRDGLRDGLERVKRLQASSGHDGTMMGFGQWDRGALKGHYLVLREWRDGKTVQYQ